MPTSSTGGTLRPGTRLGRYEVLAPAGAGGMGEVYKALDTRLQRIVALKVVASQAAWDPGLRRRFEREAKAISALDHPHICSLYDMAHEEGIDFLVMQFLEGETLAQRLRSRPLDLREVLRTAIDIADALDVAHRTGIVHRDLKPANIMLTKGGAVLLDFGIAKVTPPADAPTSTTHGDEPLTELGVPLGTVPYMSPEQLRADPVDGRSDLFAFGAIVYEMVTGQRAFAGATQTAVTDAILHHDPPRVSSIRANVPPLLDQAVAKCLQKDPADRWQSAGDLNEVLTWAAESLNGTASRSTLRRQLSRSTGALVLGGLALAGTLGVLIWTGTIRGRFPGQPTPPSGASLRSRSPAPAPTPASSRAAAENPSVHLSIPLPVNLTISATGPELAIAPDGRRLVFRAVSREGRSLYVRDIGASELTPLRGTDFGRFPFWSPDASAIAFFADGKLKTIKLLSGEVTVLCDAPAPRGGSWARNGSIIFSPNNGTAGLYAISADGGTPHKLTEVDSEAGETGHIWPTALPDDDRFLYAAAGTDATRSGTYLQSSNGQRNRLLSNVSNTAYAAGHLLFQSGTALMAVPFDAKAGTVSAAPFPIAQDFSSNEHRTDFSVTDSVLAYWRSVEPMGQISWTDRHGRILQTSPSPTGILDPAVSPDDRFIAFSWDGAHATSADIWLLDWARGSRRRITSDPASEHYPVWSPDGRRIIFSSSRGGGMNLHQREIGGTTEEVVLQSDREMYATDWSRDGKFVLFESRNAEVRTRDLWILSLAKREASPFLQTSADERQGRFSPTNKWIAYTSNESGRWQVYVKAFQGQSSVWQVSQHGGVQPQWSPDGSELFFLSVDRKLFTVKVSPSGEFSAPTELFAAPAVNARPRSLYAVSANGEKFVFSAPPRGGEAFITVVTNWHK